MTTPKPHPELRAIENLPKDGSDIESLWLDTALGDGIVDAHYHSIPVDKPRNFFRVHPEKSYRRRCEIFTLSLIHI